jgi:hypothetical protein
MPKDIIPADALGPPLGLLDAHVDSSPIFAEAHPSKC